MDVKTRDTPGTATFFSALLGWRFAVDESDWRRATVITVGEFPIGTVSDLAAPIYPPGTPAHLAFYLHVDDVDERVAAAEAGGADVVVAPFDVPGQGRLATLIDPFGAAVSIWRPTPAVGWRHPVALPMAPHRMVLSCPRPGLVRRFYRASLGADLQHADFVPMPDGATSPGQWQLVIPVPDLAAIADRFARFSDNARELSMDPQLGALRVSTDEGLSVYVAPPPASRAAAALARRA
ncbi:VOC family protein [Micromonospora sp. Llam7]|uniref:VOC family protein n=1 Tax=Micromonospora tarapacensis TaxID=2835305 RepID=UPI001C8296CD|nr:VOC family protein [Micromonospora tarapacensis]MBX7268842.1 VOC family protein [Micromonospora tarapacensis]